MFWFRPQTCWVLFCPIKRFEKVTYCLVKCVLCAVFCVLCSVCCFLCVVCCVLSLLHCIIDPLLLLLLLSSSSLLLLLLLGINVLVTSSQACLTIFCLFIFLHLWPLCDPVLTLSLPSFCSILQPPVTSPWSKTPLWWGLSYGLDPILQIHIYYY
jgi:hypothetical protein